MWPLMQVYRLPSAVSQRRSNLGEEAASTAVMNQHTFVETDGSSEIEVGDMIAFSTTSHPCLTFDKWRYIAIAMTIIR
ncbi:hypothetical protein O9992_23360 [Vibrio lentus]|nr:hypothetical protein [Vibrio lentus]